jgi:nitrate reductase beta subunit
MDEEMMGMQVDPVMMPDQMSGMQPQPMMQGTPAPQELPGELQQEMNQISGSDQEEAKQALTQIIKILQQMASQGASEEEIQAFLEQVGITMEELQMAREMFGI